MLFMVQLRRLHEGLQGECLTSSIRAQYTLANVVPKPDSGSFWLLLKRFYSRMCLTLILVMDIWTVSYIHYRTVCQAGGCRFHMTLITVITAKKVSAYEAGNTKGKVCFISIVLMFYNEQILMYSLQKTKKIVRKKTKAKERKKGVRRQRWRG